MERKEAIEVIKKNYPDSSFTMLREALETLIPELKESEDERIRKEIRNFIFGAIDRGSITKEQREKTASWFSWLEKQGEKKSIWHTEEEDPKRGSLILLIMQSGTPIVAQIIEPNHTFNHGERWAYIDDLLEKQGEQKPQGKTALEAINEEKVDNANKIELKFKDGDVLNSPSHYLIWIYKDNEHYYACLNMNYVTKNVAIGGLIKIPSDARPATKDERTILFENLKKFGYEWDKEKKQLKKKKVIHKELTEFEKAVKQVMEEAIECGDTHNLKADADMLLNLVHNSSWSEEDEERIKNILSVLDVQACWDGATGKKGNPYQKEINWLKSLKERYTWKPSDEQMKAVKEAACYSSVFSEKTIDNLISLSKDLKKLKG